MAAFLAGERQKPNKSAQVKTINIMIHKLPEISAFSIGVRGGTLTLLAESSILRQLIRMFLLFHPLELLDYARCESLYLLYRLVVTLHGMKDVVVGMAISTMSPPPGAFIALIVPP